MEVSEEVRAARAEKALDQRARRAAKRVGLVASKSSLYACGQPPFVSGFALYNPAEMRFEFGLYFDLTAEEVIQLCLDFGK